MKQARRLTTKNLSEIAWEMGYNSVAHLSGQFKRKAGYSPSYFNNIKKGNMIKLSEKYSVMRNHMANLITEHPEVMKMCMQEIFAVTFSERG